MPHHPGDDRLIHLALVRQEGSHDRRKKSVPPAPRPDRGGRGAFSQALGAQIKILEEEAAAQSAVTPGIKPHLVFRVPVAPNTSAASLAKPMEAVGIRVLNVEPDGAIIAFHGDANLADFKKALRSYRAGPKINPATHAPYASTKWDVFEIIEVDQMRSLSRNDRIGRRLASEIGADASAVDNDKLYIVDVELWHAGSKPFAREALKELEQLIAHQVRQGERLRDRFLGDLYCLARISVFGPKLRSLLEMQVVAEVDLPPAPAINATLAGKATKRDFPTPPPPPEGGPSVCILDSGVTSNHPLLSSNIGHTAAIMTDDPTPVDVRGHGTKVAGIAVYGDVLAAYNAGEFSSPITLYSARVLNSDGRFDDEELHITQIRTAIETFAKPPYKCRVFNLSVGSELPVLTVPNARQTQWAEDLDTLARELRVLLVVAAGNHMLDEATNAEEAELVLSGYPDFLFERGAALSDPATAAIAVTVGGLAEHEAPESWDGEDQTEEIDRPVARRDQPTPSTRIGPGVNNSYKPDFVAHGGNSALRGSGPLNHLIRSTMGYGVLSFSHRPQSSMFAADVGTSFAAPKVARMAAMLWHRLKETEGFDPHPNLVRALLANSASVPQATRELITARKGEEFVARVCGYGVPDLELATHSGNRRVTLIASGELKIDGFYLYQVPITEEFLSAPGKKRIIVSLAFDPPVRRRRAKYLGVSMQPALFRGVSVESIIASNTPIPAEEKDDPARSIQGAHKCGLTPGPTDLASSTLHRCEWTMSRRGQDYGDTYYLLVKAVRNWAPPEITHQHFGLAVTLAADNAKLYASVRQRVQQRARMRGRE